MPFEFCPFETPAGERCTLGRHGSETLHSVAPASSATVQTITRQENIDVRLGGERVVPEDLGRTFTRLGQPGQVFKLAEPEVVPATQPVVAADTTAAPPVTTAETVTSEDVAEA